MNFATFDLNLLRVFDALMRERSVTRAGDLIGLSQPAVSNALNRLRHALEDELFVRRGHDMVPTPRAEALAENVREALAQLEQAIAGDATFDPAHAERVFTLLGSDFFSVQMVPDFAERMARLAPGITLRFLDSASGDVERLLRDNAIDAALERPLDLPEWTSRHLLFHSSFVIAAARGHAALGKAGIKPGSKIPLRLFCELPHAMRSVDGSLSGMVDQALHKAGLSRRVVLTLPQFYAVALAVAQGRLIAALPVQFARTVADELDLALYRLPVSVTAPDISMYWHRRHDRNPAHQWLRAQIVAAVEPLKDERF
jgi:DNA-binding transcriptional LysR family regulator